MENVTGRRNFVTEYKNSEVLETTVISIQSTFANTGKINYFF